MEALSDVSDRFPPTAAEIAEERAAVRAASLREPIDWRRVVAETVRLVVRGGRLEIDPAECFLVEDR